MPPEAKVYTFAADPKRRPDDAHEDAPQEAEPYVATPELTRAVNLAIFLRRPLLLEGEAGCGKSRLAHAVAYELGLPLEPWYVRSTSEAREGLYSYDAILRLHDVQTAKEGRGSGGRDPGDAKAYRTFGALGAAFARREAPTVVLIDEIDKADVDFPNDLLAVLDDPWAFDIPETGEYIIAKHLPIVIITSNKEKGNLPAPFLRRCIYHYIEFPSDPAWLARIVAAHYGEAGETAPVGDLVEAASTRFLNLREQDILHKKPGTSEFLDWLKALYRFEGDAFDAAALADPQQALPFPELLFKLRMDWLRYRSETDATA